MLSRLLLIVAPVAVSFALARVLLWLASLGTGISAWEVATWGRWDSGHYVSIAEKGYVLVSCAEVPGYPPTSGAATPDGFRATRP
jgi:hypothetical protein